MTIETDAEEGPSTRTSDDYRKRVEEMQKRRDAEQQVRQLAKAILTPEAFERMSNIKLSNEGLYYQVVQLLVQSYQQGQIKGKVSEDQLKQLVASLLSKRRETTIRRL